MVHVKGHGVVVVDVQLRDLLEVLPEDACSLGVFIHGGIGLAVFREVSYELGVSQQSHVEVGGGGSVG